jgi:hypothetical protein
MDSAVSLTANTRAVRELAPDPPARPAAEKGVLAEAGVVAGLLLGIGLYLYPMLWWHGKPIVHTGDVIRLYYEALLSSRGQVLYRDVFEYVQPGTIFLMRGWAGMFGWGVGTLNGWVVVYGCAVAVLLYSAGRFFLDRLWSLLASVAGMYIGVSLGAVPYHRLAPLLLVVSALVVAHDGVRRPSTRKLLFAALFSGAAFLLMQSEGLVGATLVGAWLLQRGWRREAAIYAAALLVLPIATLGYFIRWHATGAYIHYTWWFPVTQATRGTYGGVAQLPRSLAALLAEPTVERALGFGYAALALVIIPAACAGVLFHATAPARLRLAALVLLGQMAAVIYGPHLYRLLAVMLGGLLLLAWFASRSQYARLFLVFSTFLIGAALIHRINGALHTQFMQVEDRVSGRTAVIPTRDAATTAKAEWLFARTSPGDTVALYRYEPSLLFLGDLHNPGPFLQIDEGGYISPAEVQSILENLRASKPRVAMWRPPLDETARPVPIRDLQPLRDYLFSCYRPSAPPIDYTLLLERRTGPDDCELSR